jgi:hypothetical protein
VGSGPPALPPSGRLGMPLPGHCRSRGFAPPQRIAVPSSRRRIAACCRSWGSSRFLACRFATGQAGRCARRLSRDAGSYPSKNPLAGSRTASPRPLRLLRFHRIRCLARPLAQPDGDTGSPPITMGSGRPIARPTSTHGIDRAP